jgi:hypothetical protein
MIFLEVKFDEKNYPHSGLVTQFFYRHLLLLLSQAVNPILN